MENSASRSLEDILAGSEWFCRLAAPVRQQVLDSAYQTTCEKNEYAARLGEPAHSWIYVSDGLLKIKASDLHGRVTMLTGVPKGGWIGEGAVIKRELRRYDIVALRDSRLVHIPASTFRWLLDSNFEFNHFVIAQLNERLSQFWTMIEIDRLSDPVSRVAKGLANLFNPVLYPNMSRSVPLGQQDLGELVGLSRQSVSAALRTLKSAGIIHSEYGNVIVKDITALQNYPNGPVKFPGCGR